jgi:hypothetical protein
MMVGFIIRALKGDLTLPMGMFDALFKKNQNHLCDTINSYLLINNSRTSMPLGGLSSPLFPSHHFDIIRLNMNPIDRSFVVIVQIGMM